MRREAIVDEHGVQLVPCTSRRSALGGAVWCDVKPVAKRDCLLQLSRAAKSAAKALQLQRKYVWRDVNLRASKMSARGDI